LYSSLDISILVHATEDANKIRRIVSDYFIAFDKSLKITSVRTEGHWRNPIFRLRMSIKNGSTEIFNNLYRELMTVYGEDTLEEYLSKNTDERGYKYMRLDKQKFCIGKIFLSDSDSIRLVFKKPGRFVSRKID
jgi:RNA binding exosome subunit